MKKWIANLPLKRQKTLAVVLACVLIVLVILLSVVWNAAEQKENRVETTGYAMGSVVQQTVYGENAQAASDAVLQAVTELENRISWRVEGSDVARLNDNAGVEWISIEPETASLLSLCREVAARTGGVFDPTVLPVSKLWDFTTDEDTFQPPTQETIDRFLPYVNYEDLRVREDSASLKYHYMGIDLGSAGKGAACDTALASYAESGADGAVVAVGGSVGVFGEKPDGSAWSITVRNPYSEEDGETAMGVMEITEGFVSTSGTYEKQREVDGVTYHHLINANTGWPEDNELVSVTVYTKANGDGDQNGALSDILATAAYLLGPEEGAELLRSYGAEGLFITREKTVMMTEGFPAFSLLLDSYTLEE